MKSEIYGLSREEREYRLSKKRTSRAEQIRFAERRAERVREKFMNATEDTTYRTAEVRELTGLTLRQLQWWDEQKIIQPIHDGHVRLYTEHQLFQVRLMAELRSQGVSLQQARGILRKANVHQTHERLFFVSDGRKTFSSSDAEETLRAILRMNRAKLAICELPARKPAA